MNKIVNENNKADLKILKLILNQKNLLISKLGGKMSILTNHIYLLTNCHENNNKQVTIGIPDFSDARPMISAG